MPDRSAHPADLQSEGWLTVGKRVMSEASDDHISLIAAGCAFYGLMALFPGIVAVMAIAGFFLDQQTIVEQTQSLAGIMPQEAAQIVIDQAKAVAGSESAGLGLAAIIGVGTAFYSATAGMRSLMEGLNVAFDIEEQRGFVRALLVRSALTLGLIVGFLLIIAALLILPIVLTYVIPGDGLGEDIMSVLRWPLVLAVVIGGLAILYQYGPNRTDRKWRWITPGAIVGTALWIAGSVGFAFYVRNFGSYNETFGALGGVIVLLMWLWLSAYIVLLGAEFDSELERKAKSGAATEAADPSEIKKPREGAFSSAHTS